MELSLYSASTSLPDLTTWQSVQFLRLLRVELERIGLGHVCLEVLGPQVDWQGAFVQWEGGALSILIGASMDVRGTLHHEAVHILRAMGAFSEDEWAVLRGRAIQDWISRFDIVERYPGLGLDDQVEEAIAEAFAARVEIAGTIDQACNNALHRIGRILGAIGQAISRLLAPDPDAIFSKIQSGEIGRRIDVSGKLGAVHRQAQRIGARR